MEVRIRMVKSLRYLEWPLGLQNFVNTLGPKSSQELTPCPIPSHHETFRTCFFLTHFFSIPHLLVVAWSCGTPPPPSWWRRSTCSTPGPPSSQSSGAPSASSSDSPSWLVWTSSACWPLLLRRSSSWYKLSNKTLNMSLKRHPGSA